MNQTTVKSRMNLIRSHSLSFGRSGRVFGRSERFTQRRFSDWTRFRLARVIKWTVFFALFIFVASKFLKTSPVLAIFQLPALIWAAMPFVIQIVLLLTLAIGQFVAIFWFLSRGGVDVYYPDDIKTSCEHERRR
jgi:cell division protease FtsH